MKTFVFLAVFFCLSLPSSLWAVQLTDSEAAIFRKYLELVGEAYNFDLTINQPIPIGARTVTRPDGSRLDIPATTLWGTLLTPTGAGKRPTILVYCPYRRDVCMNVYVGLVNYGYNVLVVDIRGTGSSEGKWQEMGLIEQHDLAFIVDSWIPGQAWADGKVGMMGTSYTGAVTLMDGLIQRQADGTPVHLKAVQSIMGFTDYYKDFFMHGGNPQLFMLLSVQGATALLSFLPQLSNADDLTRIWNEHYEGYSYVVAHWLLGSDAAADGLFFDVRSSVAYWPRKPDPSKSDGGWGFPEGGLVIPSKMAVMLTSGWFDIGTRGQMNGYQYGLAAQSPGDKAMVVGPWYHADGVLAISTALSARWFDWKLKGISDPFMVNYPVVLFVMGADRWRAEKTWPLGPSRVSDKRLYLSKKRPSVIAGDSFSFMNLTLNYGLADAVSAADFKGGNPVLAHDPTSLHGVRSRSFQRWTMGVVAYVTQQLKYSHGVNSDASLQWEDERSDELGVLTFTTAPLKTDIEIAGPLSLTFWARTSFGKPLAQADFNSTLATLKAALGYDENALIDRMNSKDVQWVVELNDVFPAGRARNITSGWLAASRRPYDPKDPTRLDPAYVPFDPFYDHGDRYPASITDGQVYPYVVELWPTDNTFKAGHRIRISISASDYPHLFPVLRPSKNTLVLDDSHRAHLDFKAVNGNAEGTNWMWITGAKNPDYTGTVPARTVVEEFNAVNAYLLGHSDAAQ